jgi:protoheme IX farnesyltransferase
MFSERQLSRITFIWIVALAISVLLIPSFAISSSVITGILLIAMGIWLTLQTKTILYRYFSKISFKKAFLQINIYVLMVVFLLSIDKLLLTEFLGNL